MIESLSVDTLLRIYFASAALICLLIGGGMIYYCYFGPGKRYRDRIKKLKEEGIDPDGAGRTPWRKRRVFW